MISEQQDHIKKIRDDFQASQRIKESLNNSIQALAEDLYSKDTHFIFELIQNAEDNEYKEPEPSLSLRFAKTDPTGTRSSDGALIIENNEIGFSPENVDALCAVGRTTKSKIQGFIGEKGIGFKSVFRITSTPHIFSNSYSFCLPEYDEETGLGYIVPRWIAEIPKGIKASQTTIILPLDKSDIGRLRIEEMVREIEPETILFLSKLKEIIIKSDFGYEMTILKDDSRSPLIQLLVEGRDRDSSFSYSDEFLFYTRRFEKPPIVNPEIRRGITERDISIAFPLNSGNRIKDKVFAYLPVCSDTGLPFLINADFLLPSSREAIKEDEPWNIWLRDRIADVFVEAFENWLAIKDYRTLVYRFIPVKAHKVFFEPVVESIQGGLSSREVVLTEPDGLRFRPEQTRTAYKNFRSLLYTKSYPRALLDTPLVLNEIEAYADQLKSIGVRLLTLDLVKKCFQDKEWMIKHDLDWLLECYKYLASQNFETGGLIDCPIVPVESTGETRWSCDSEQPVYFCCDEECERILSEVPDCVRVPLAFLHRSLYERVEADDTITAWMTKALGIYDFSDRNYAVDVLNWLENHFDEISPSDLVAATVFLSQFTDTDIDFKDIPILLADGRRMRLSEAKALPKIHAVVTPQALDPETGWQNMFTTRADREHMASLSDMYITDNKSSDLKLRLQRFWTKMQITAYPMPYERELSEYDKDLTEYEKNCFRINNHYSTGIKSIRNYLPLLEIANNCSSPDDHHSLKRSESIVLWLSKQERFAPWRYAILKWFYYTSRSSTLDSEFLHTLKVGFWLPSTKGLVRPIDAFLPVANIKEVLGDSVPYFERNLPAHIVELLGIRTNITAAELVSLLDQQSKSGVGSREFAERVYRYLNSVKLPPEIIDRLRRDKLIFVPMDSGDRWITTADVIWKDRKSVLSEDFVYLERIYPRLKDLFVDTLDVKEDVDPECYARRWLKLQGESDRESRSIESILSAIYSELRPICLTNKEIRPEWWREFVDGVKVWTQEKRFENPSLVYVPDDGELRKIFQGNGVPFAWRPEKDSFSDWAALYRALDLPYLSEAVSLTLGEGVSCKLRNRPAYLTKSAKILTATWIREERPGIYKLLLTNKVLDSFLNTKEAGANSLKIVYHLKEREVEASCDSFWDKAGELLLVTENQSGRTKNTVARMLARALMPNRAYKELADWIELVLGEEDWHWRIQQKNWQVPNEVRNWMDGLKQQGSPEPAELEVTESAAPLDNKGEDASSKGSMVDSDEGAVQTPLERPRPDAKQGVIEPKKGKDKRKVSVSPEEEDSSVLTARGFDFRSHLENAFNRPGATKVRDEREPNHQPVGNPERRREKEAEGHIERIGSEPDPVERRRKTERVILEGPDEQVRQYLGEWYGGKCQICGDTFPERDGRPFFIANYIVPRKHARQVDTYANALCLCAEHFAKWQHGAVESDNIIDQINNLELSSEGGSGQLCLIARLCGEECLIRFNEKHVIALQELLSVTE